MDNSNESEVKTLIVLANKELEAHNFKKSKKICNKALQIDAENPNIYLILFLAQYKVTEIEDLQKCEIDYKSELYKTLRKYAGNELNAELNKYLSDKYENKTVSRISSKMAESFKKLWGLELFSSSKKESLPKQISSKHETAQGIFFACFFFIFIASFVCCVGSLNSENNYIDTICFYIVIISFWVMFFRLINREPEVKDKLINNQTFKFFIKTLIPFFLSGIFIIVIHYLFYWSIENISEKRYLLGLLIGIIPTIILPITYKIFYNLVSNMTELFYTLPPETRRFIVRFFSKR